MLNPIPQGSKVGIISPSVGLDSPILIQNGLNWLKNQGYQTVLGKYVYEKQRHLAGTPQQRAEDIMRFFKDKEIKALFCTCGGYSSHEILPLLDYDIIRQNPKPIIGFSDVTALQMGIYAQTGNIGYAGILLKYDFYSEDIRPETEKSMLEYFKAEPSDIRGGEVLNHGSAHGHSLGTDLCVFQSLVGTPYYPDIAGSILFLEDVDEKTYCIQRMLTQLAQQPEFNMVKAVIFGKFNNLSLNHPDDKQIDEIIRDFAAAHPQIPMVKDFPYGHIKSRKIIPLGINVSVNLNTDECVLKIER